MKITHNNKEYVLDIPKAISLGVLKENYAPKGGDVFKSNGVTVILVEKYDGGFIAIGNTGDTGNSSPFLTYNLNKSSEEIKCSYLCDPKEWKYLGNINERFKNFLETL